MLLNRNNFRNYIGKKVMIVKTKYPQVDDTMLGIEDILIDETCKLLKLNKCVESCCLQLIENNDMLIENFDVCKLEWEL